MVTSNQNTNVGDIEALIDKFANGDAISKDEAMAIASAVKTDEKLRERFGHAKTARQSRRRRVTSASNSGVTGMSGLDQSLAQRNSTYGGSGRVVSPGGFKKSGFDYDSRMRNSGKLTPDAVLNEVKYTFDRNNRRDGGVEFNGRKYSKDQVDRIRRRAVTGATLGIADQAIWDRIATDERKAAEDAAMAESAAASAQAERAKAAKALEEWKAKQDYEYELKRREEQAKAEAEAAKVKAFNERHGIPDGTRLSQKDMDLVESGRKKWDYSPSVQRRLDDIRQRMDDAAGSTRFSSEEIAEMQKEAEAIRARYSKSLQDVPEDERTDAERMAELKRNGGGFDKSGKFFAYEDPEARDYEEQRKYLDGIEAKNESQRRALERAYYEDVAARRKELMIPDVNDATGDKKSMSYLDATKQAEEEVSSTPRFQGMFAPAESNLTGALDPNAPQEEITPVMQNAQPPAANDWRARRALQTGTPVPQAANVRQEQQEIAPQQEYSVAQIQTNVCPICGEAAMVDGVCQVCGYREGIDPLPSELENS